MPRRALLDYRPWLLASLLAGVTYFFVMDDQIGGLWLMLWKGAGVAFLAMYAALRGRGTDGVLIAMVMALGAAGDMGIELDLRLGGALFAAGHLLAIALYLRNRREKTTGSQKLAAVALAVFTPLLGALMTYPQPNWQIAAGYSLVVGVMAAFAWTSRFPRYRVGMGAVLFVVSDLLIFAREGGAMSEDATQWLIWPLYYAAQFLIATGVVQTLRRDPV
ncbi:lysoplasmalogenase [Qipengyuania marisflavi]|uniref:Lysoplasmalogenase n=1 Tax=Qipengyuania marisflavi TaxID=2486356 RepID=A0A5S3P9E4_9SPHN|nr:lysoplasmalogenase [Qipengyuania marisflavi]TMM49943.1 lysoplasmalogenase [Qipengyuania marisflavi]